MLAFENAHDTQTIQFRHLQIEECEIGPFAFDNRHGLRAGLRLAHQLDVGTPPQHGCEKRASGALVVRDNRSKTIRHHLPACGHLRRRRAVSA